MMTPQQLGELKPELVLRPGTVHVEIVRYAKERDIDLIVMGTHGRGLVAHAVLGSVAERVVRYAPCPVLTVRNPQHEFIAPAETGKTTSNVTM
jgi:nucleotide-binding universal stress UspA family protein